MEDDLATLSTPPASPSHAQAAQATLSPRTRSPNKRMRSRLSRRDSSDDNLRARLKNELYLSKEFIDFDVMKGSAFFHTKPANHDKKLVKQGFVRALFVPLHPQFWRQKVRGQRYLFVQAWGAPCVVLTRYCVVCNSRGSTRPRRRCTRCTASRSSRFSAFPRASRRSARSKSPSP
jgi:hypothetical protein